MKIEKLNLENENGEEGEATRAEYVKMIIAKHNVQAFESEAGTAQPVKIVAHIIDAVADGKDVDEAISGKFPELVAEITVDVERTKANKVDKKAEAAAKKDEKDKAAKEAKDKKEAEELALQESQELFVSKIAAGSDLAQGEYAKELADLGSNLPDGVTIKGDGNGFGVEISKDASSETVGHALGYLMQKSANSTFIGNQLQFWIGDVVIAAVGRGIYANGSEASKSISKLLNEKHGKSLVVSNIDAYRRMAERTPFHLRNPKVDATAYLAVSSMKVPRQSEGEKDEDYKTRVSTFEKDREAIQSKLASGEITKRKDVLVEVENAAIKNGLKEAKEEGQITISQHLGIFFHASFALEELLSVHKDHENEVVYRDDSKTGEAQMVYVSKEDLEKTKAESYAALTNALYKGKGELTAKDFIRGFVEKQVKVEVTKDAEGKPVYEEKTVKNYVYPAPFFQVETAIEEAKTEPAPKKEKAVAAK